MENKSLSLLLMAFIAIIIGAGLITTVAVETNAITELTGAADEVIDITDCKDSDGDWNATCPLTLANLPTGWKSDGECPNILLSYGNSSKAAMTLDSDYTWVGSTGNLTLVNNTGITTQIGDENTTYVNYQYCDDDYVNQSWARTVLDNVSGFFGLAILAVGIFVALGVLKNEGVLDKI